MIIYSVSIYWLKQFHCINGFFNLVAPIIPDNPLSKLSKFQSFTLTLMKLRLNTTNFDVAFRFGVSQSLLVEYCQDGLKQ